MSILIACGEVRYTRWPAEIESEMHEPNAVQAQSLSETSSLERDPTTRRCIYSSYIAANDRGFLDPR